jgi:hypothetical protein
LKSIEWSHGWCLGNLDVASLLNTCFHLQYSRGTSSSKDLSCFLVANSFAEMA